MAPTPGWMLGWFSDASPEHPIYWDIATNFEVLDDHTVELETITTCGGRVDEWSMTWEEDGDSAIRLLASPSTPASFGESFDGFVLRQRPDCDDFELLYVIDGQVLDDPAFATTFYHARLCMTDLGEDTQCQGSDCNRCEKEWCEGTESSTCAEPG